MSQRGLLSLRMSVLVLLLSVAGSGASAEEESRVVHVGFSNKLLPRVNVSDALAATQVWGEAFIEQTGVDTAIDVSIQEGVPMLDQALTAGDLDLVGMTINEFSMLYQTHELHPLYFVKMQDHTTEEYLVLVRKESHVSSINALRQKRLLLAGGIRTTVAFTWLETYLLERGFGNVESFFSACDRKPKASTCVLQVFFGKADACVVSRSSFETICALNPQIGRQLTTVMASPGYIPALLCWRASYKSPNSARLAEELKHLHKSSSGELILSLFLGDQLVQGTPDDLKETLSLIERHKALLAQHAAAATTQEGVPQ